LNVGASPKILNIALSRVSQNSLNFLTTEVNIMRLKAVLIGWHSKVFRDIVETANTMGIIETLKDTKMTIENNVLRRASK
jgi:hypothetical protein